MQDQDTGRGTHVPSTHVTPPQGSALQRKDSAVKQYGTPGNLHPNQFGERLSGIAPEFNATSDQADNAVRIVGGDSQVLDGNALRVVEQQIHETVLAGGDTSALQAQAAAIVAPFVNIKSPMPVRTVALNPLARVPTPVE